MAESVVSSVGQTIGKLLVDEAKFLWDVEGEIEGLQRELQLIQCLLRDADAKQAHDQAVRECVAQLRDLAYDAEDVIEQYILRVAPKKEQNIIKAYACFMAKCSCVRAHVVGTEIEGLKSKISDIGNNMRNYGIRPLNEGEGICARVLTPQQTYAHFEEEDFVGREDGIEVLVKELKDRKHRVVAIWGMGGLGKTTHAKKVFNHDILKNHFDGFAWACISQEYNVRDILERILVKLIPDQRERVTKMRNEELLETLYMTQKQKRCIVVLDDIWTKQAWDGLRAAFPVKDTRSKLLITTRNKEVVEYIDPHCFLHELQCLSHEESWVLLKKRAFPGMKVIMAGLVVEISSNGPGVGRDIVAGQAKQLETEGHISVITEDMKNLAYELLEKCAGLPLAIIVLGGLLAINEWKTIHETINLHFSDNDLSKLLALSYEDLPWHLKPCFLFLGNFPEDVEIPATKVLHMWIAEGFVLLNAYGIDQEIPVEDVAEQYLMELVNRGMVQVQFKLSGKIKSCHLHDLMRDLCVSKALQESFLSTLNIQHDNEMENCSASMAIKVELSCKPRRLSLNQEINPSLKPIGRTLFHLRTLMSFESFQFQWDLKPFYPIFNHCKFLRVLKLENLNLLLGGSLPESLGDLVHLRFLSLKNSYFRSLPQSMGNLICMEFLDLLSGEYGDFRVSMPNVLWKMRRLRYLRLPLKFAVKGRFHWGGEKLQLGTLKNLRTLKNFHSYKCDMNDIGKFTNLQNLTIFSLYDPIEKNILSQLAGFNLNHLRSSYFYLDSFHCLWTEGEFSKMSKYTHSCKLFIGGKIEKLPKHRSLPQKLRKLVLLNSQLEEDPMPILEKLPHLVVLMLEDDVFKGNEMVCSAGGFPQLKHLFFYKLKDLEEWRATEGAVPHLSRLGIYGCDKLRVVPSHVSTYDGSKEILEEKWKCGLI